MSGAFDMAEFMEQQVKEEDLAVQKEVVEQLAAEKAQLHENIEGLESQNKDLSTRLSVCKEEIEALKGQLQAAISEKEEISRKLEESTASNSDLKAELEKAHNEISNLDKELTDALSKANEDETLTSSKVALLDRDLDLPDRFTGETRDHVLEVIREARDAAEASGRVRRAQLLEGVLVVNTPDGGLAKKREALEKFFKENGNVINGIVISELERCGIPYKNGEDYLLPKEILLRTY